MLVSSRDLVKRELLGDWHPFPSGKESASLVARAASSLSACVKSSLPRKSTRTFLNSKRQNGDAGCFNIGGVSGDRSADGQQIQVRREIRAKRDLNDVVDAARHQRPDLLNQIGTVHHVMCAGVSRKGFIGRRPNRRDHGRAGTIGVLHCADPDSTGATLMSEASNDLP